jgi:hypothetical protein
MSPLLGASGWLVRLLLLWVVTGNQTARDDHDSFFDLYV